MKPGAEQLSVSRVIKASKETVWQAWKQPELFEKWFAPAPVRTISKTHQFYSGGGFASSLVLEDGTEFGGEGCFLFVREAQRIVFTDVLRAGWRPNEEPFFTLIFDIEGLGGMVRVTATALHKNENDRRKHSEMGFVDGWGTTLKQLEELVLDLESRTG